MWRKILLITLLYYFFALLQNSFFAQVNFFGAAPNLVFSFFFVLAFFAKEDNTYYLIFLALIAGFFIDMFSFTYLFPSIIILIVAALLLKNIQSLLKNRDDNFPYIYFAPLFIIFILAYDALTDLYFYFFDFHKVMINFQSVTFFSMIYSLIFSSMFFYIFKKFLFNNRGSSNRL